MLCSDGYLALKAQKARWMYYNAPTPPRARYHVQDQMPQSGFCYGSEQMSRVRQAPVYYEQREAPNTGFLPSRSMLKSSVLSKGLVCDKCDGNHATESCPYFKSDRDKHADAWMHYCGRPNSKNHQRPVRESVAPRSFPRSCVTVARMPGDGSCLFHSIAHGLGAFGFREDDHVVRQRIANFIAQRPDCEITGTPLRDWIDWDSLSSVSGYVSRLASGGLWGGAIEMASCAKIYGVDIGVYEEDYNSGVFHRISDFLADGNPRGAVCVLYSGRSHYDALVPIVAAAWHGNSYQSDADLELHRRHGSDMAAWHARNVHNLDTRYNNDQERFGNY